MAQNNPANIPISIEQILVALQQLGLALASNPGGKLPKTYTAISNLRNNQTDGTPFVILPTAGPATNVTTASSNLPASGSVPPAASPIANIPAASPGISGGGAVVAPIAASASPAVSDTTTFKGKAPADSDDDSDDKYSAILCPHVCTRCKAAAAAITAAAPSRTSTSTSTAADAALSTVAPAAISAVAPSAVACTVAPVAVAPAADAWYIVTVGRNVGVFRGNNVQPLVSGVSGFYCKCFASYEAATIAFAEADSLGLVEIKN
ncbi:hypothetical protein H0H81_010421 [Sphagnurus paluster]|uniref:Uncharacterized protein n=1 Tax=Sphagnurus paluster TaxID=117069 RepID=A0A9P7K3R8_9AGAR|nr:hypothetical protein H0H81_010421 [Sphagnurus paluster]